MKKIRLDLEMLDVQSFATDALPRAHGTVRGAQEVGPASERCYSVECGSGMCAASGGMCWTAAPDPNCLVFTAGQDTCQATCQNCNVTDSCPGVVTC